MAESATPVPDPIPSVTIDVRLGVTILHLPDGSRKALVHGQHTGTVTIDLPTVDVPVLGDHPDAEKADEPWQPLMPAKRARNGVPIPEPEGMTVWKNNLYTVQRTEHEWPGGSGDGDEPPRVIHLSIRRNDRHWARDWRHFQQIKNELVGPEHEGIELYPAESRMMDMANQYHCWVLPEPGLRWPVGYEDGRVVSGSDEVNIGSKQRPFSNGEVETVTPEQQRAMAHAFLEANDPDLAAALDEVLSDNPPGDGLEATETRERLRELLQMPVRMWMCPIEEHGDRPGEVTVEWQDGVAHCTQDGCSHNSAEAES